MTHMPVQHVSTCVGVFRFRLVDKHFVTGSSSLKTPVWSTSLRVALMLKWELASYLEKMALIFMGWAPATLPPN